MSLTEKNLQIDKLKQTATIASVALSVMLTVMKLFAAVYTGSLAILSSLIDSMADIFASSITFVAVKIFSFSASF